MLMATISEGNHAKKTTPESLTGIYIENGVSSFMDYPQ